MNTIHSRVELIVAVRRDSSHDVHVSLLNGLHLDHSPCEMPIAHCAVLM